MCRFLPTPALGDEVADEVARADERGRRRQKSAYAETPVCTTGYVDQQKMREKWPSKRHAT